MKAVNKKLEKKRIIVTGATGIIGLNLINRFLLDYYQVCAIVRPGSKNVQKIRSSSKVEIIECDLKEYPKLVEYIDKKADIFVNLAWNGTRGNSREDKDLQEKNYRASLYALETAYKLGCNKFIGAGTLTEYGIGSGLQSETMECYPVTEYGIYKLKSYVDGTSYAEGRGIVFVEPRFSGIYGPEDYPNTLIMYVIRNMLLNKPCIISHGYNKWNYLYAEDAANAIAGLIDTDVKSGAYNIASEDTRLIKDFVLEIKDILNSHSDIVLGNRVSSLEGKLCLNPDISKIKNAINWTPDILFREGIEKILATIVR